MASFQCYKSRPTRATETAVITLLTYLSTRRLQLWRTVMKGPRWFVCQHATDTRIVLVTTRTSYRVQWQLSRYITLFIYTLLLHGGNIPYFVAFNVPDAFVSRYSILFQCIRYSVAYSDDQNDVLLCIILLNSIQASNYLVKWMFI
jgi:hypothetical protein